MSENKENLNPFIILKENNKLNNSDGSCNK